MLKMSIPICPNHVKDNGIIGLIKKRLSVKVMMQRNPKKNIRNPMENSHNIPIFLCYNDTDNGNGGQK